MVDRPHCHGPMSIYFAPFIGLLVAGDQLSLRHGLVGDEPLLFSIVVSLGKSLWARISMAHSSSHPAFVTGAALFVRGAALVSPVLAGGDSVCFGGCGCPRVNDAAFHPGTRHTLAGWLMDVPLFVHGAHLFSSDDSGHSTVVGILARE